MCFHWDAFRRLDDLLCGDAEAQVFGNRRGSAGFRQQMKIRQRGEFARLRMTATHIAPWRALATIHTGGAMSAQPQWIENLQYAVEVFDAHGHANFWRALPRRGRPYFLEIPDRTIC